MRKDSKVERFILITLCSLFLLGGGILIYNHFCVNQLKKTTTVATPLSSKTEEQKEKVTFYITGAVKKPGVYSMDKGSRINDAVKIAGGNLPSADLSRINLAGKVKEEDMIRVPFKIKVSGQPPSVKKTSASPVSTTRLPESQQTKTETNQPKGKKTALTQKVNVNTARESELVALPGIGPALAKRIIDYREKNGLFRSVDDLKKVRGIKYQKFSKFKDFVEI